MLNASSKYPLTGVQTAFHRLDSLGRNVTFGSKSVRYALYVIYTGTFPHDLRAVTHFNLGVDVMLFCEPGGMYVLSRFGGYDEKIGGRCKVNGFWVLC